MEEELIGGKPDNKTSLRKMVYKILSVPPGENSKDIRSWRESNQDRWIDEWNNYLLLVPNKIEAIKHYHRLPFLLKHGVTVDRIDYYLLEKVHRQYLVSGMWLGWWAVGSSIPEAFIDSEMQDFKYFAERSRRLFDLCAGIMANPLDGSIDPIFYEIFKGNPSAFWLFCEIIECRRCLNAIFKVVEVGSIKSKKEQVKIDRHLVNDISDLNLCIDQQIEPGIITILENLYPGVVNNLTKQIINEDSDFESDYWEPFVKACQDLLRMIDRNPKFQQPSFFLSPNGKSLYISSKKSRKPKNVNKCNNFKPPNTSKKARKRRKM